MRAGPILWTVLLVPACAGSPDGAGGAADDVASSVEVKVGGDRVGLHLHVTNTGARAIEFTFPSSQRYDFVVRDEAGEEVWRWSEGMMFLQAISHATLAPGETWDFEAAWDAGNRTGRFQVVARVTAAERDVRQSAAFELP